MKTLITDYAFNKTAKQVIFLGNQRPETIEQMLLITNVTTGEIIYNFADRLRGGVLDNNVLTLTFDTSTMSNSDNLQIFIDSDDYHNEMLMLLSTLLKNTSYSRDAADRMRVIMDNNPMLYTYMRNSSTSLIGGTETFYSISSWNTVDAREQLMAIQNLALQNTMERWTR
jgi:hypothetical protein